MKKLNKIFILLLFIINVDFVYTQTDNNLFEKEIIQIDSLNFIKQDNFQAIVNRFKKSKYYIPDIENDKNRQILDDKSKALEFAKFLMNIKFGKKYPNYPKKYFISEDKDKNLWFITCDFINAALDGNVYMIIVKKNCKLLYYFANA